MRRLLILFSHYFTDHLSVNYLIIQIILINIGSLFPEIARLGQKFEYLNNIAIMWQIYWELFYSNFTQIRVK